MEIYASITQKVSIDPIDVIEKLIEKELGSNTWTVQKNNKYFKVWEESAGCHSFEAEKEINKESYEYVEALNLILKKLKETK